MPTYLPQIEPNRTGTLTSWDIPMNDWLGVQFGVGSDDTVLEATRRWSEDFFDDSPELTPEQANSQFGTEGLKFTSPVRVQTAMHKKERKEQEKRYEALLNAASHDSLSWKAAAGTAAMMLGSVSNPLDLAVTFIPFIGEEKIAAGVARFGSRAFTRGLLGTTEAFEHIPILRRFPNLTASVINGTLGNAVAEIPIGLQKWSDQADYGLGDAALNIASGGVLGGGFHISSQILKRIFGRVAAHVARLDPATAAEVLRREAGDAITGRDPSGFEAVRWSEDEIAKEIRARNVFDEASAAAAATQAEEAGAVLQTPPRSLEAVPSESGKPVPVTAGAEPPAKGSEAQRSDSSKSGVQALTKAEALELQQLRLVQEAFGEEMPKANADRLAALEARETSDSPTAKPVLKEQVITERAKRIADYVEREKARHEIEVQGKIKDEIASRISAQQAQGKLLPDKEVDRWSRSEVPESRHVEALKTDAKTIEQQMILAAGPEGKEAATERIAKLKEQAAAESEEKAIAAAIDCVGAGKV